MVCVCVGVGEGCVVGVGVGVVFFFVFCWVNVVCVESRMRVVRVIFWDDMSMLKLYWCRWGVLL